MDNINNEMLRKLNIEFDFINKETKTFLISSYKLGNKSEYKKRSEYISFIERYSDLRKDSFKDLSVAQLYLITIGIASGIKLLPLILLTYPLFSEEKLNGLIYVLENKNVLNLVIEQLVFMKDDEFVDIINRLKRGEGCAEILTTIKELDPYENIFNMTNELDDEFFSELLDQMDVHLTFQPKPIQHKKQKKKGTVILFDPNSIKRKKQKK